MSNSLVKRLTCEWRLDTGGVAVFALLTIIAYAFAFAPAMRDRETLRQGTEELVQKREQVGKLNSTIHVINGQISAVQTAQAGELKLQPSSEINDRLSSLSTMAASQGLLVEAIEPGESAGAARFSTVPIRMNGRGSYAQFSKFLHKLRTELPDTSVTDVGISGGGGTPATFTINFLWYAAPAPVIAKTDMQ
jgi:Tfp pilus assembly protein PilO